MSQLLLNAIVSTLADAQTKQRESPMIEVKGWPTSASFHMNPGHVQAGQSIYLHLDRLCSRVIICQVRCFCYVCCSWSGIYYQSISVHSSAKNANRMSLVALLQINKQVVAMPLFLHFLISGKSNQSFQSQVG